MARSPPDFNSDWRGVAQFAGSGWRPSGRSIDRDPTLGLLPDYKMFLCVRDFGQHLDCARFMTCRASMFKKMVSKYAAGSPNALSMNLNVFSQQELTAWQHIVHQAFVNAIKDLMADLDQDVSKMNTQSKGYLSVW